MHSIATSSCLLGVAARSERSFRALSVFQVLCILLMSSSAFHFHKVAARACRSLAESAAFQGIAGLLEDAAVGMCLVRGISILSCITIAWQSLFIDQGGSQQGLEAWKYQDTLQHVLGIPVFCQHRYCADALLLTSACGRLASCTAEAAGCASGTTRPVDSCALIKASCS